jgi:hypothetical protein
MAPNRILVLLHPKDSTWELGYYLLQFLMREWEAMGFTVRVIRGIRQQVEADLVIPHVDLTITPEQYRDFLSIYPNVINKPVHDISKSRISVNLVGRNDTYAGPVIVKTDRNCGGLPERLSSGWRLGRWKRLRGAYRLLAKLRRRDPSHRSWRSVQYLQPSDYPVFPSVHEVPEEIFQNRNLVVEKFLSESDGSDYCVRYYYFFGSAEINLLFRSKASVVKAATALKVEEVPVPEELYKMRKKLGFDYGKFDYVLRDGKVVLFDVNRTPATTLLQRWGLIDKVARHLAGGINSQLALSQL